MKSKPKLADNDLRHWKKYRDDRKAAALYPVTMDNIRFCLIKHEGNLTDASKDLGMTRSQLNQRIQRNPSLKMFLKEIEEEILDLTEKKLRELVSLGNVTAVSLYLRTKGKERGYTEKSTVEHEVGENAIRNASALIDAMRKGSSDDGKTIEVEDYKWVEPKQLQDQTS